MPNTIKDGDPPRFDPPTRSPMSDTTVQSPPRRKSPITSSFPHKLSSQRYLTHSKDLITGNTLFRDPKTGRFLTIANSVLNQNPTLSQKVSTYQSAQFQHEQRLLHHQHQYLAHTSLPPSPSPEHYHNLLPHDPRLHPVRFEADLIRCKVTLRPMESTLTDEDIENLNFKFNLSRDALRHSDETFAAMHPRTSVDLDHPHPDTSLPTTLPTNSNDSTINHIPHELTHGILIQPQTISTDVIVELRSDFRRNPDFSSQLSEYCSLRTTRLNSLFSTILYNNRARFDTKCAKTCAKGQLLSLSGLFMNNRAYTDTNSTCPTKNTTCANRIESLHVSQLNIALIRDSLPNTHLIYHNIIQLVGKIDLLSPHDSVPNLQSESSCQLEINPRQSHLYPSPAPGHTSYLTATPNSAQFQHYATFQQHYATPPIGGGTHRQTFSQPFSTFVQYSPFVQQPSPFAQNTLNALLPPATILHPHNTQQTPAYLRDLRELLVSNNCSSPSIPIGNIASELSTSDNILSPSGCPRSPPNTPTNRQKRTLLKARKSDEFSPGTPPDSLPPAHHVHYLLAYDPLQHPFVSCSIQTHPRHLSRTFRHPSWSENNNTNASLPSPSCFPIIPSTELFLHNEPITTAIRNKILTLSADSSLLRHNARNIIRKQSLCDSKINNMVQELQNRLKEEEKIVLENEIYNHVLRRLKSSHPLLSQLEDNSDSHQSHNNSVVKSVQVLVDNAKNAQNGFDSASSQTPNQSSDNNNRRTPVSAHMSSPDTTNRPNRSSRTSTDLLKPPPKPKDKVTQLNEHYADWARNTAPQFYIDKLKQTSYVLNPFDPKMDIESFRSQLFTTRSCLLPCQFVINNTSLNNLNHSHHSQLSLLFPTHFQVRHRLLKTPTDPRHHIFEFTNIIANCHELHQQGLLLAQTNKNYLHSKENNALQSAQAEIKLSSSRFQYRSALDAINAKPQNRPIVKKPALTDAIDAEIAPPHTIITPRKFLHIATQAVHTSLEKDEADQNQNQNQITDNGPPPLSSKVRKLIKKLYQNIHHRSLYAQNTFPTVPTSLSMQQYYQSPPIEGQNTPKASSMQNYSEDIPVNPTTDLLYNPRTLETALNTTYRTNHADTVVSTTTSQPTSQTFASTHPPPLSRVHPTYPIRCPSPLYCIEMIKRVPLKQADYPIHPFLTPTILRKVINHHFPLLSSSTKSQNQLLRCKTYSDIYHWYACREHKYDLLRPCFQTAFLRCFATNNVPTRSRSTTSTSSTTSATVGSDITPNDTFSTPQQQTVGSQQHPTLSKYYHYKATGNEAVLISNSSFKQSLLCYQNDKQRQLQQLRDILEEKYQYSLSDDELWSISHFCYPYDQKLRQFQKNDEVSFDNSLLLLSTSAHSFVCGKQLGNDQPPSEAVHGHNNNQQDDNALPGLHHQYQVFGSAACPISATQHHNHHHHHHHHQNAELTHIPTKSRLEHIMFYKPTQNQLLRRHYNLSHHVQDSFDDVSRQQPHEPHQSALIRRFPSVLHRLRPEPVQKGLFQRLLTSADQNRAQQAILDEIGRLYRKLDSHYILDRTSVEFDMHSHTKSKKDQPRSSSLKSTNALINPNPMIPFPEEDGPTPHSPVQMTVNSLLTPSQQGPYVNNKTKVNPNTITNPTYEGFEDDHFLPSPSSSSSLNCFVYSKIIPLPQLLLHPLQFSSTCDYDQTTITSDSNWPGLFSKDQSPSLTMQFPDTPFEKRDVSSKLDIDTPLPQHSPMYPSLPGNNRVNIRSTLLKQRYNGIPDPDGSLESGFPKHIDDKPLPHKSLRSTHVYVDRHIIDLCTNKVKSSLPAHHTIAFCDIFHHTSIPALVDAAYHQLKIRERQFLDKAILKHDSSQVRQKQQQQLRQHQQRQQQLSQQTQQSQSRSRQRQHQDKHEQRVEHQQPPPPNVLAPRSTNIPPPIPNRPKRSSQIIQPKPPPRPTRPETSTTQTDQFATSPSDGPTINTNSTQGHSQPQSSSSRSESSSAAKPSTTATTALKPSNSFKRSLARQPIPDIVEEKYSDGHNSSANNRPFDISRLQTASNNTSNNSLISIVSSDTSLNPEDNDLLKLTNPSRQPNYNQQQANVVKPEPPPRPGKKKQPKHKRR